MPTDPNPPRTAKPKDLTLAALKLFADEPVEEVRKAIRILMLRYEVSGS